MRRCENFLSAEVPPVPITKKPRPLERRFDLFGYVCCVSGWSSLRWDIFMISMRKASVDGRKSSIIQSLLIFFFCIFIMGRHGCLMRNWAYQPPKNWRHEKNLSAGIRTMFSPAFENREREREIEWERERRSVCQRVLAPRSAGRPTVQIANSSGMPTIVAWPPVRRASAHPADSLVRLESPDVREGATQITDTVCNLMPGASGPD